jgi:hypothetical protein
VKDGGPRRDRTLPGDRSSHTCLVGVFAVLKDRKVLIAQALELGEQSYGFG